MFKKILVMGPILFMLILGFTLIPTHIAHADTCSKACGQDPVQAKCTNLQYVISSMDFTVNTSTWRIREMGTKSRRTACKNQVWASLILIGGTNFLGPYPANTQYIMINSVEYDILSSTQFQSGAYTNMVDHSKHGGCAYYTNVAVTPNIYAGACE